jgi:16S rRNA (guanine(966)-N(2))-methyltransferase RsmD
MRVIAGEFRRRVLAAPRGMATRPTSDRLRETLFNVLAPRIAGARFLDLFAGSGAVGIEALSRGAAEVVFVEKAASVVKVIRENLEMLGVRDRARVQTAGAGTFLRSSTGMFDVVFLDPPYEAAEEYAGTLGLLGGPAFGVLAEGSLVVAEHRRKEQLEERYGVLVRTRVLEQGDAGLSFYAAGAAQVPYE